MLRVVGLAVIVKSWT
jgi:hypothetical protein